MGTETIDAETMEATRARIYEALKAVYDPELGVNVVDLGLVYGVRVRPDGTITVTMTLTTPGCPMHKSLGEGVAQALGRVPGVTGGELELVWDPPWDPSMMTATAKEQLGWPA
jgi:metal-sulfur cluster biosynthetic enzyme